MKKEISINDQLTDFILYNDGNKGVKVETYLHNETIWLPQKRIAQLFGRDRSVISKHIKGIFKTDELDEKVVCALFAHTTQHGAIKGKKQTKYIKYYNLDMILSVGYRVNSYKATQFRIWATSVLKQYLIKGFAMDDDKLKNGRHFGKDYFKELLERVRSIRTSERRVYQQITDIFAECCIDYDKNSDITQQFYANVQNKFHFAITGETAAEIIYHRVDKHKPIMGLLTFKNAPNGRVLKSDVIVAKNYLNEKEIKKLERTISSYFDYIENQIELRKELNMQAFSKSVDKFLNFNDFRVLQGYGSINRNQALQKASDQYDEFNKTQKIISDFDQFSAKNEKTND